MNDWKLRLIGFVGFSLIKRPDPLIIKSLEPLAIYFQEALELLEKSIDDSLSIELMSRL